MTEIQAWEFCAKHWNEPKTEAEVDWLDDSGICRTLQRLLEQKKITCDLWNAMDDKILLVKKEPSTNKHWPYCWIGGLKGAKLRVKFCREQIRKLKKAKKK